MAGILYIDLGGFGGCVAIGKRAAWPEFEHKVCTNYLHFYPRVLLLTQSLPLLYTLIYPLIYEIPPYIVQHNETGVGKAFRREHY